MFGFQKSNTKEFNYTKVTITLYRLLVLPHIIYAICVWGPTLLRQWSSFETMQHELLRHLSYKIGQPLFYLDHNYEPYNFAGFQKFLFFMWVTLS